MTPALIVSAAIGFLVYGWTGAAIGVVLVFVIWSVGLISIPVSPEALARAEEERREDTRKAQVLWEAERDRERKESK